MKLLLRIIKAVTVVVFYLVVVTVVMSDSAHALIRVSATRDCTWSPLFVGI